MSLKADGMYGPLPSSVILLHIYKYFKLHCAKRISEKLKKVLAMVISSSAVRNQKIFCFVFLRKGVQDVIGFRIMNCVSCKHQTYL